MQKKTLKNSLLNNYYHWPGPESNGPGPEYLNTLGPGHPFSSPGQCLMDRSGQSCFICLLGLLLWWPWITYFSKIWGPKKSKDSQYFCWKISCRCWNWQNLGEDLGKLSFKVGIWGSPPTPPLCNALLTQYQILSRVAWACDTSGITHFILQLLLLRSTDIMDPKNML